MKIEIVDPNGVVESVALGNAVFHCMRWDTNENKAIIYVKPRLEYQWLEYGLLIETKESERIIFISMIQRQPGAEFEFHS